MRYRPALITDSDREIIASKASMSRKVCGLAEAGDLEVPWFCLPYVSTLKFRGRPSGGIFGCLAPSMPYISAIPG